MHFIVGPVYGVIRKFNIALPVEGDMGKISAQQTVKLFRPEFLDMKSVYSFARFGEKILLLKMIDL
jgi:hypothetical protein